MFLIIFKKLLTFYISNGIIFGRLKVVYAPVAQLDRVFGYEPKGRGFESLRMHHFDFSTKPSRNAWYKPIKFQ